MNLLVIAVLVVIAALIANDLGELTCSRCVRHWAVFDDGRCWKCWRAARRRSRA